MPRFPQRSHTSRDKTSAVRDSCEMASKNSERAPEIVARYEAGTPVKEIIREFALSQDTVYRLIDAAGVPRRGRGNHGANGSSKVANADGELSVKRQSKKQAGKARPAKKRATTAQAVAKKSAAPTTTTDNGAAGSTRPLVAQGTERSSAARMIAELTAVQERIEALSNELAIAENERRAIAGHLAVS